MGAQSYNGKYRAKVVDVNDPEKRGRIRVQCPKILSESKSSWCEPCVPVAYDLGGDFAIPKVGEFVWVEFESGDHNKPIYTGGLWSKDKSPSPSYDTETRLITWGACKITMTKDSIELSVGGSKLLIDGGQIHLQSASVLDNGRVIACVGDSTTEGGTIVG